MDPNVALREIRRLVKEVFKQQAWSGSSTENMLEELAEHIDGLDQWLSKGGFLPDAWTKVSREQIEKLTMKYEVPLTNLTPGSVHPVVGEGECLRQFGEYLCTKPIGHPLTEKHVATAEHNGRSIILAEWKEGDHCPVCDRADGTHDKFAHSRD